MRTTILEMKNSRERANSQELEERGVFIQLKITASNATFPTGSLVQSPAAEVPQLCSMWGDITNEEASIGASQHRLSARLGCPIQGFDPLKSSCEARLNESHPKTQ
jgi:hypothetical protein